MKVNPEKLGVALLLVLWLLLGIDKLLTNYFDGKEVDFFWAVWKGITFFIILYILSWRDTFSYGLGLLYGVLAAIGSLAMLGLLANVSIELNSLAIFSEPRFLVKTPIILLQLVLGIVTAIIYYPLFRARFKK